MCSMGKEMIFLTSTTNPVATARGTDLISNVECIEANLLTRLRSRPLRGLTRSHPPPHAGCPRGDPGPLAVLTSLP